MINVKYDSAQNRFLHFILTISTVNMRAENESNMNKTMIGQPEKCLE